MTVKERLLDGIADRSLKLAVAGIGYVGLPLAVAFAEAGFDVTGIDVSSARVALITQGQSYVEDVPSAVVRRLVDQDRFRASMDYAVVSQADAVIICVPTPLRKTKDPDISHIVDAAEKIATYGGSEKLIVLESTTYPGTTEEILLPRLTRNGSEIGRDVFLAFSPERIDPGRSDYVMKNTPKVVGGITKDCLEVALALYGTIVEEPIPVSNTATAEMVKLLENTFRAVNIGLVNEMAMMCDRLGLDVWEVIAAAETKPYGFMSFYPGPGLGGHCVPIDPHYLSWKLRTVNYAARFIELADDVNSHMPEYVVGKISDALNNEAKPLKGSKILIVGVAYKPNVGDVRESPALDVIHLLRERGAEVTYHDPLVSELDLREVPAKSVEMSDEIIRASDCLVVITNHDGYDWRSIAAQARLIVDTRNALEGLDHGHIVRL